MEHHHNFQNRARHILPYLAALLALSLYGIFRFEEVVHPFATSLSSSIFSKKEASLTTVKIGNIEANKVKGRVFRCGYEWPVSRLFPDFDYQSSVWDPKAIPFNTTYNDILVYGMHGPCASQNIETILQKDFAGKVLYINGEPNGNVWDMVPQSWILDPQRHSSQVGRLYQMGPYPDFFDVSNEKNNTNFERNYQDLYHRQSLKAYQMALYLAREIYEREESSWVKNRHHQDDIRKSQTIHNNSLWQRLSNPTQKPRNTQEYRAIVYLAKKCHPHRQRAARQISTIMSVHHGETCTVSGFNASRIPATLLTSRSDFHRNDRIFRHYKYCLSMENVQRDGYMTEKLLNAYLGGCLPVYYGTTEVFDIFNPNSFVFFDVENPGPALDLLVKLESNDTLYEMMLSQPILQNGDSTADQYFSVFPSMGSGTLNRKFRKMMGLSELPLL